VKLSAFLTFVLVVIFHYALNVYAEESTYLIKITTDYRDCPHGLHRQPSNGPFSIYIFCDDAMGTNIGIIHTEPGSRYWPLHDRFWQEEKWALDINSFAWSPSLNFAYVTTNFIYGDGRAFKLNLRYRIAEEIVFENKNKQDWIKAEQGSRIIGLDLKRNVITVSMGFYDTKVKKVVRINKEISLE
jgi:hypothetical protein